VKKSTRADGTATVRLRPGARLRKRLRKAKRLTITVRATARDTAGRVQRSARIVLVR
jgi:hypothetical protein